jgi:hypothetical protein
MFGFIGTSVTISLNYNYHNAITDFHKLQFTVIYALGFSVSTSRLLATDLDTETTTSNRYEVFLPFLAQSPWNLGTQLKFISAASRLAPYSHGTDNAENTVLLLCGADNTENTSHICCCVTSSGMCKLHGHKVNTAPVLLAVCVLRSLPSNGFTCIVVMRLSKMFIAPLPSYTHYSTICTAYITGSGISVTKCFDEKPFQIIFIYTYLHSCWITIHCSWITYIMAPWK